MTTPFLPNEKPENMLVGNGLAIANHARAFFKELYTNDDRFSMITSTYEPFSDGHGYVVIRHHRWLDDGYEIDCTLEMHTRTRFVYVKNQSRIIKFFAEELEWLDKNCWNLSEEYEGIQDISEWFFD